MTYKGRYNIHERLFMRFRIWSHNGTDYRDLLDILSLGLHTYPGERQNLYVPYKYQRRYPYYCFRSILSTGLDKKSHKDFGTGMDMNMGKGKDKDKSSDKNKVNRLFGWDRNRFDNDS